MGLELRDCTGSPAFCEVIPGLLAEGCVRSGFLLTGRSSCEGASGLYDGVGYSGTLYIGVTFRSGSAGVAAS